MTSSGSRGLSRLVEVWQCGIVVAAESVADAKISTCIGEIGVEIERPPQPPLRLLVEAREQVIDRQCRMRGGVAVIGGNGFDSSFTAFRARPDGIIAPPETGLEMDRQGESGQRHRIAGVERDGLARSRQASPKSASVKRRICQCARMMRSQASSWLGSLRCACRTSAEI